MQRKRRGRFVVLFCVFLNFLNKGTFARDPNAKTFVQHSGVPKGYNQVKVHAIYDVLSKMYLSAEIHPQPEQDEIGALEFLLTWYDIAGKVLLVGDRGYSSYALFASPLERENTDLLIRVKQGRGAMNCIANLPMQEFDRQAKSTITTTQTKEDKARGYKLFRLRTPCVIE